MLISFRQKLAAKFYHGARKKSSDNFGNHKVYTFKFSTSQNRVFNILLTFVNNVFNIFNNC